VTRWIFQIPSRLAQTMPGFVDTHHHQFETALRSFLADGLLFNDGKPHGAINYFEFILDKFTPCTGRRTSTSTSCSEA
jgi:5-methylthioadenosine/S-adenosylhomocysteine deaminase